MGRSWYIGTYWDIPVKIHWSFGLMFFYIGYLGYSNNLRATETLWLGIYILVIFFCVVLHEYGHALTARRYGIATKDIILSPIGGIARMQKIPDNGWEEFKVAIAGPLVNVVIATIFGGLFYFSFGFGQFLSSEKVSYIATLPGFLSYIIASNIALFIFNLIPAFPMDGGRILRALLSLPLGTVKATKIASIVGRIIALGFIFFAWKYQLVTMGFIGIFIFFMATMENRSIIVEDALRKLIAKNVMRENFTTFSPDDVMQKAIDIHESSDEKSFLVIDNNMDLKGTLPSLFIDDAIKKDNGYENVSSFIYNNIVIDHENANLLTIYNKLNNQGASIAAITKDNLIVGVIDRALVKTIIKKNSGSRWLFGL